MSWAPDYVASNELKSYLRINDNADDAQIAFAVTAASRAIDSYCNRQFGQVDTVEERLYTPRWDSKRCRWIIDIDDVADVTGLVATIGTDAIDVYTLEPVNAVSKGLVWTRLVVDTTAVATPTGAANEASVTALWGWGATPVAVEQAALIQAARFFSRRESPYGVAGSPQDGTQLRLQSRVDPDVGVALRGYQRARKVF